MIKLLYRLSKRERVIAYFVFAGLSLLAFDRLVLSPVTNRMRVLNREVISQEKRLVRSLSVIAQEEEILKEYDQQAKKLKQTAGDEEVIMVFQSNLERLAERTGLTIANMRSQAIESGDQYKRYSVEINARATMAHLADFLFQLERDPQLFRVVEFRLSSIRARRPLLDVRIVISQIRFNNHED